MGKKVLRFGIINILMVIAEFVIVSRRFLNLNFLNFNNSPVRMGFSWMSFVLWLGIFIYMDYQLVNDLLKEIRHQELTQIQNQEIDNISEAIDKLLASKRNNPKLSSFIDKVKDSVVMFTNKKDIMIQLLANNGYTLADWSFINEFNCEAEKEILVFVRLAIDSGIVFDDPNEVVGSKMYKRSEDQLNEYNEGIQQIIEKYDEFLHVVKQIIEKKLRKKGDVVTDSLELTIESAKIVYGLNPVQSDFVVTSSGTGGTK